MILILNAFGLLDVLIKIFIFLSIKKYSCTVAVSVPFEIQSCADKNLPLFHPFDFHSRGVPLHCTVSYPSSSMVATMAISSSVALSRLWKGESWM